MNRIIKLGIIGVMCFCLGVVASVYTELDYPASKMRNMTPSHHIVLEPGWKSSCNSNFVAENIDKKFAIIEITIGKRGKVINAISPWDKSRYNLIEKISF